MSFLRLSERNFESPDLQTVTGVRLLLEEVEYKHSAHSVDEQAIQEFLERGQERDGRLYLAAQRSGEIVAAAEVNHEPEAERTMLWNIAITKNERGDGVGSAFMQYVAHKAAKNGSSSIYLFPIRRTFFEHLGFIQDPDDEEMMVASPETVMKV